MAEKYTVHPYIPNSEPRVKQEMLDYLGMKNSEDIYKEIPDTLRFKGELNIPAPIMSEYRLQRHMEGLLKKTKTARTICAFSAAAPDSTMCLRSATPSYRATSF